MSVDYLPTDGETYAGPLVFTFLMQALEDGEDAIEVLLVKPDSVICYQAFEKQFDAKKIKPVSNEGEMKP